jgi:ATP-dependent exoDNAse (exonuclease V) beta subunit
VGDVKQAIFTWREGDPRLFRDIFSHYNSTAPGTIREERLDRSWRSGPPVIAMVNRVLGDQRAMQNLFPADAVRRWSEEWRDHESARPELGGFAELRHAADEPGRFFATLRLVEETRALERGLSVAVLVQKNDTAAALADFLRREGNLPAVAESELHVGIDNPLTCTLLALVHVAAHPGDRAAWEHVAMTPLAGVLERVGVQTPDALTRRLLGEIHTHGFERTLEAWLRLLESSLEPQDRFSRECGRQLVAAARLFDETGSRDAAEFGQFAARHTVRDTDTAAVVRVMTVHKAKGLGFDLVILPDLEGKSIAARRRGLAVHKGEDRSVEWVLDLPSQDYYAKDEVLLAHASAAEADACYEKLCLLYVAMTRAKRAMYVITQPVNNSISKNFPRLLCDTLGEEWSDGDPAWFEKIPVATKSDQPLSALPVLDSATARRVMRRPSRRPSSQGAGALSAGHLFRLDESLSGANFGEAVHGLLAEVEWIEAGATEHFEREWSARGVDVIVRNEALSCLVAPELTGIWARLPQAIVWRERAFEVVLDGAWVSGRFDRVLVELDWSGRALRARLFDFKTDRIVSDGAALGHGPQMQLYRRVVSRLTGLPEGSVLGELAFTRTGRRIAVPLPGQKF